MTGRLGQVADWDDLPGQQEQQPRVEANMNLILTFDGYWSIDNASSVRFPGIYCIYAVPSAAAARLLYIGEAHNIGDRISSHEQRLDWLATARYSPVWFNACRITVEEGRREAEAAMIYHHKPPCNTEFKAQFPYRPITLRTAGQNANLTPGFTIR